ncbi:elongation factor 4 [bacterium]|nr:elongation factor 4 [bacterium]NCQ54771.1 elongation factor 4 [Candidatus Parcubacteria bacterium]NCS68024.1 elongation factor 4 [Candidatus Peregrinibacteria bacterium]NCS95761.1 elongation factor 4 [bacterium]
MDIRNFCIIAHIDHGKSTLADRFLETTGTLDKRAMKTGQMLDTMDLEQERGITIKLQPVRMKWKGAQLNLIDTPGHVDFSYEVSRSLAACEGAILVVDATQGIEAQTLANVFLAMEQGLTIIPVLNKIDLPAAEPEKRAEEIETVLGFPAEDILTVSAKDGTNVDKLLDAIVAQVPGPSANQIFQNTKVFADTSETKALVFDSTFDPYRGVVSSVRVFAGQINKGDKLQLLRTNRTIEALEVGFLNPRYSPTDSLNLGEVGYVVTGLKNVVDARVGETFYKGKNSKEAVPLPGYSEVTPFVYAGVYPTSGDDFALLRKALEKLSLNDASLQYEPEHSGALGHGFRVGFLGLLHLDIVQERLEREFDLDILVTAPSVSYEMVRNNGEIAKVSNPSDLPEASEYTELREPWMKINVLCPANQVGGVIKLCTDRRGLHQNMQYTAEDRVELTFEIPLASIVTDFYDDLKSISSGYASMSYENIGLRPGKLNRLDILLAGDKVDALSQIVHIDDAYHIGLSWCERLKEIIPKAQFAIAIQAAVGSRILARETISAMRKDVTAGLYGGDVSRKKKLLKKQKEGKKRLKQFGKVTIPQEAFFAMMKK